MQYYEQPLHIFLGIVSLFSSLGVDFIFHIITPQKNDTRNEMFPDNLYEQHTSTLNLFLINKVNICYYICHEYRLFFYSRKEHVLYNILINIPLL